MTTQQTDAGAPAAQPYRRDPQNFTPGDRLAWKVVAGTAGGITVVALAVGIAVAVGLVAP